MSSVPN